MTSDSAGRKGSVSRAEKVFGLALVCWRIDRTHEEKNNQLTQNEALF